jgi:hypothetical protein
MTLCSDTFQLGYPSSQVVLRWHALQTNASFAHLFLELFCFILTGMLAPSKLYSILIQEDTTVLEIWLNGARLDVAGS